MISNVMNRVYNKLFKRSFYKGYRKYCDNVVGKALLYYKTDVIARPGLARMYKHTNDWEILEILKILNQMGFEVDVIDRNISQSKLQIDDQYTVFVGIGAGDSGKHYSQIAKQCSKALKIFYAAATEPEFSNRNIKERFDLHKNRNPHSSIPIMRLITKVDIEDAMNNTDVIFCIGNDYCRDSYKRFSKDIYPIYPSSHPDLKASIEDFDSRKTHEFLYLGGNGNIVKGLDLLLEAFVDLPNLHLHVCAPKESKFDEEYKDHLQNYSNIHWHGFVDVGGEKFRLLTKKCGFVSLPSCREGSATSVTTAMRRGLIPIVTPAAGIDIGDFGISIDQLDIDSLKELFFHLTQMDQKEFIERQIKSYEHSFTFTQSNFSFSFETALLHALTKAEKFGYKQR